MVDECLSTIIVFFICYWTYNCEIEDDCDSESDY